MNGEEDFVRYLRHELRTPVNHIIGYSELLLDDLDEADEGPLPAVLTAVRAGGQELLRLISDLLDPAREAPRKIDAAAVRERLTPTVQQIAALLAPLLAAPAGSEPGSALPDLEHIRTATSRLLELLQNLSLDIPLTEANSHTAAHVAAAVPRGSPRRPSEGAVPAMKAAAAVGSSAILVVDDDQMNRDLLARRLERLGYSVSEAENGRLALEVLEARPFDLLLLDILMPELNGYQVLERMNSSASLRTVPVLVLSSLDEVDSAVRCIEMGAEDYLPKPVNAVLLQARIGACLEKKRLRDQEREHLKTIEAQAAELEEWTRTLETRVQDQVEELERLGRLRRFLSPQLAEVIASPGNERLLESHRREITVVFCDLRGFTAFAETAEPEEVMQVLREYHTTLGEIIYQYEGTLEHFAGDGLMVFFNDPVPCPDPSWRAVQMGAAMRDRVGELARAWRRRGHTLGFGVGIALGYATLGRIGFEGRYDYGAIGTVTNLAARLCSDATAGQILVSGRVHAAVEDLVEAEPIGELTLKGFSRSVPALNIIKLKQNASLGVTPVVEQTP